MTLMTVQTLPPRVAVLPQAIEVVVDEEDILLGTRRNPAWCPIARALRRTLVLMGQRPECVCVGGTTRYGFSTVSVDYGTPSQPFVQYHFRPDGFINLFDAGEDVEPRTFTLVPL